jgi:lysyl-tRNA synthetase class 1
VVDYLYKHRRYCIYGGKVNPVSSLIWPTVFEKPLALGNPNYREFFAPIIYLHPYANDDELERYFTNSAYRRNAMYVSFFGRSPLISKLVALGLHSEDNILLDTDLHRTERGYLPYGGLGPYASSLFVNGKRFAGATLPQRDIYRHLVECS